MQNKMAIATDRASLPLGIEVSQGSQARASGFWRSLARLASALNPHLVSNPVSNFSSSLARDYQEDYAIGRNGYCSRDIYL